MKVYAVKHFGEPLLPLDRPEPIPVGTEVVVEVSRCGVCHTDLHLQDGYYDMGGGKRLSLLERGVQLPMVMGHEVLGKLVAKAPDAPILDEEIGKTFLVYPWLGCGECEVCRTGKENLCLKPSSVGVFRAGGYADKCVVPHPRYLVDVTGIDPSLAATFACSGITAYSALRKLDIDRENGVLLLMGLGGVGLTGLNLALALGYRNIVVADIDEEKRELARSLGVKLVIDPREADAPGQLLTDVGGVAAAVDFVGTRATAEFAISLLAKGGTYVVVGLFGGDITLSIPPLVQRSISIRGSYVGSLDELHELIALSRSGRVKPLPVETLPFEQVNNGLDRLRSGKVHGRLVLSR